MGEEEFKDLYEALRGPVFAYAARRLTIEQAKDVVSETFEVVWRKRRQSPDNPEEWAAWCVGIAKKKVLQEWQRKSRKHHDSRFAEDFESAAQLSACPDIADTVADSASGKWVWNELTTEEKMLANVAFLRQLTTAEASALLSISISAYTTRVNRLRRHIVALQASLERPDGDSIGERAR